MGGRIVTERLSPAVDTPMLELGASRFRCLLGSWRSADGARSDGLNEDTLVVKHDDERIAFAVCDGVSQSFMPHLASAAVAAELIAYLWDLNAAEGPHGPRLSQALGALTRTVSADLDAQAISPDLPGIVREVLEEKRPAGSQAMFAGALADTRSRLVVLTWMGDTRLRLWSPEGAGRRIPDRFFDANERWSSKRGLVGRAVPHVASGPLNAVGCLAVYSDGLAMFDDHPSPITPDELRAAFAGTRIAATSDDASFIQVMME